MTVAPDDVRLSRRTLLGAAGAGALAVGGAIGYAGGAADTTSPQTAVDIGAQPVPFDGEHQAGITTPAQDRLHLAVFDVTTEDRGAVIAMLQVRPGRQAAEALAELPRFSGDALQEQISGGDIVVQVCANDPQVAVHAIRNLVRIAFGTANIKAEDDRSVADYVWVQPGDDQAWMGGGSYLVTRKIMMRIETWDWEALQGQERIIGRAKGSGGPMSGGDELAGPDFHAVDETTGEPSIDRRSHVHLAHPTSNCGARLLRRGYNFVDGSDGLGQLAAGLFFIAYQRDPRKSFIPIQRSLGGPMNDLMNEYIVHVGSGIFACPGGVRRGGYWGNAIFA